MLGSCWSSVNLPCAHQDNDITRFPRLVYTAGSCIIMAANVRVQTGLYPFSQYSSVKRLELPNHADFLFRTGVSPLATVMRRLLTGYAVSFSRRHKRHGQLFQNRYKSIVCQEATYLRELVRYIHLNPVRAGIVENLKGLNQ